jgi:hypothetical protein
MKRGMITGVICLGFISLFVRAEEPAKDQPKAGTPKITFDSTVYDFGKTSQVERVTGTFVFHNAGDGVLKMDKPQPGCGCTVAGLKPEVLQPGEKGELTYTINLPKTRANLQKQITDLCNDPVNPRTVLTIKADYVPLYDLSPSYFSLNVRKGEVTNVTARVSRTDGKKFTITSIKPTQTNNASWIQTKAEPDPNSTNGAVVLTTTLKPEGSPRYFSDLLNVYVDEAPQPAFSLTVYGKVVGDLTLSREMLYWPITDPAKAVTTQQIIVRSSLPEKLEVKNLTSSLKDVNVEAVTKDDKTIELIAKLGPVPERSTNGVIRFETNVPSQPKMEVPITISLIRAQQAPAPAAIKH